MNTIEVLPKMEHRGRRFIIPKQVSLSPALPDPKEAMCCHAVTAGVRLFG
jgi:hypothetical protein